MPDMREVVDDLALQTSSLDRKGRVWQDGECGKTESVARRRVWQDGQCGKTESVA